MVEETSEGSDNKMGMGGFEGLLGEDRDPDVHMLLKVVILGVIGVVCILGNIIALGTLFFYKKVLRIPIYIIIGGLALSDIIVTLMVVPQLIITHLEKGEITDDTWCKIYGFLFNSCQYIAAFHLVVLAVFRGVLLTDRAHHGPRPFHALITSCILWGMALLANIPIITLSIRDSISLKCVVSFKEDDHDDIRQTSSLEDMYTLLSAAFAYFLPLVLMFLIYILTGYMSKRYFEDSYSPRERRLSKLITYLILSFAFCRLPYEMVHLLFYYQMKNETLENFLNKNANEVSKLLVWRNVKDYLQIISILDMAFRPIIYASMSREFGAFYDKVINCAYCKEEPEDEVVPARLRRRGREIEEVLHTPLRNTIDEDFDCVVMMETTAEIT